MKRTTKKSIVSLSCVLPVMAYFLIFSIPPIYYLFSYSFTNLRRRLGSETFIGLDNYKKIFTVSYYSTPLLTTLIMAGLMMVFGLIAGFGIALLLNNIKRGKGFFRTLWYIPVLLSMPVVAKLLGMMLWDDGAFNKILIGLGAKPVKFFESVFWMYFWVVFLVVWKSIGGSAIIFIAGLNSINKELYEAAKIDGAGRTARLFRITLPLLMPVMGFVVVNGVIAALGTFEPVKLLSVGQPGTKTVTVMYQIWNTAFVDGDQGLASAMSVIMFLVTVVFAVLSMMLTDRSLITGKVRD